MKGRIHFALHFPTTGNVSCLFLSPSSLVSIEMLSVLCFRICSCTPCSPTDGVGHHQSTQSLLGTNPQIYPSPRTWELGGGRRIQAEKEQTEQKGCNTKKTLKNKWAFCVTWWDCPLLPHCSAKPAVGFAASEPIRLYLFVLPLCNGGGVLHYLISDLSAVSSVFTQGQD